MSEQRSTHAIVLGQKYAFATAALILGILSFINLLGLEKPIVAIIFGWLALRAVPEPRLQEHRRWAEVGIGLAIVILITVPTLILLNLDRFRDIIVLLSKIDGGR